MLKKMISENYTIGQKKRNGKRRKPCLVFGNKITDIEGWEEALESEERYVPHHVLEWKYTEEELRQMNRYDEVPAEELIWMPRSIHNSNKTIHKGLKIKIDKLTKVSRKKTSDFGIKFYNHYGINRQDNIKLYKKEHEWYRRNHKCRWEK